MNRTQQVNIKGSTKMYLKYKQARHAHGSMISCYGLLILCYYVQNVTKVKIG